MKIIDTYSLLSQNDKTLLMHLAAESFHVGKFSSLDDILQQLNVDVIIEPGIPVRPIPSALEDAETYWRQMLDVDPSTARQHLEEIQKDKGNWSRMPLRGLYEPQTNVIKLYPQEMQTEYNGQKMKELLVSTLAHETMHAYFNRPRHKSYPYIIHVEEPLAEFGMLLYLQETGSKYYQWAYKDVSSKKTCYRYGANLMDSYLSINSKRTIREFLESYKRKLDGYPMIVNNGQVQLGDYTKYQFTAPNGLNWLCYDNNRLQKPIYWAYDHSTRSTYITCTPHQYKNPCTDSLYPPHLSVDSTIYVDRNVEEFLIDEDDWLRLPGSDLPSIKTMHIDYRNPRYKFISNVLIDKKTNTIIGGLVSVPQVQIPNGPTSIGHEAFFCHVMSCRIDNGPMFSPNRVKGIYVPDSVTSIDGTAFLGCDNATISLPKHFSQGLTLNTKARIVYRK